jgi:hypothetical protein
MRDIRFGWFISVLPKTFESSSSSGLSNTPYYIN